MFPLTWLVIMGVVASLALVVIVREGNLAWDDADYLRRGLRITSLSEKQGVLALPHAVELILRDRPKPPLMAAWVVAGRLVLRLKSITSLILFASVVPYALLLAVVARVASRFGDWRAAALALACTVASPLSLSFGARVMVESLLSLWVLLIYAATARLLEQPSRNRALILGASVAGALLSKMTAVLFLPMPLLYACFLLLKRHRADRAGVRVVAWTLLPILVFAGPWYARNLQSATQFAAFSARYNETALGQVESVPVLHRIAALSEELAGWPLLATLAVAWLLTLGRRSDHVRPTAPAAAEFTRLVLQGAGSAAAILLIPSYFDPRFLLPVWPALAVSLGLLLGQSLPRLRPSAAWAIAALLAHCVGVSGYRLHQEYVNRTYWGTKLLIDRLVNDFRVSNIGNLGNCADWNVCKTGLLNELRPDAESCFVLHDLSRGEPDELRRRIPRFDAVVVLDLDRFPPSRLLGSSGLNRAYETSRQILRENTQFKQVNLALDPDMPPLLIYVRGDREPRVASDVGRTH